MMIEIAKIDNEISGSLKVRVEAYTAAMQGNGFVALGNLDSLIFSPGEAKKLALALLNAASVAEGAARVRDRLCARPEHTGNDQRSGRSCALLAIRCRCCGA